MLRWGRTLRRGRWVCLFLPSTWKALKTVQLSQHSRCSVLLCSAPLCSAVCAPVSAGEEAAVPLLQWRQGARVADGVPHPLHQGHRGTSWKRRASGRAEERTGNRRAAASLWLWLNLVCAPWAELSMLFDKPGFCGQPQLVI